ncbi:MAG TPA: hypothetical protein VFV33_06500 [Gemmatimonadaceae bacterium]|nr:hypothetical protein [Gemmatimonadaceae bacterium]
MTGTGERTSTDDGTALARALAPGNRRRPVVARHLMSRRLIPCDEPPESELDALVPERPVKVEGTFVHRYRDATGRVRFERVTSGWGHPRWFRVEE